MNRTGALIIGVLAAVLVAGTVAALLLAPEPPAAADSNDTSITWSGPVRPAGDPGAVVMLQPRADGAMVWSEAPDVAPGWADVARVSVIAEFQNWSIGLAADSPRRDGLSSEDLVLAFGYVVDTTGDGVADYELGIDTDAVAPAVHVWLTDLVSGEMRERFSAPYGDPFDFWTSLEGDGGRREPNRGAGGTFFNVGFAPDELFDLDKARFYAWSSLSEDGQVVAWDYAPDDGWLVAPAPERQGCTPVACPMIGPAPGPGARTWVVNVENGSADDAHLFVAEDRSPMGELVGTAVPASVPPGASQRVTFSVPAGSSWAIFVNPSPNIGPIVTEQDVPPEVTGQLPIVISVQPGGAPVVSAPSLPGWFGN